MVIFSSCPPQSDILPGTQVNNSFSTRKSAVAEIQSRKSKEWEASWIAELSTLGVDASEETRPQPAGSMRRTNTKVLMWSVKHVTMAPFSSFLQLIRAITPATLSCLVDIHETSAAFVLALLDSHTRTEPPTQQSPSAIETF